jgi:transposase-like protein
MKGHGSKFGRKKEAAIAALITLPNVEKAAQSVGISAKTLRLWMRIPEFEEAYRQARLENSSQIRARCQQACPLALATLVKVLAADSKASEATKLRAAIAIARFTKHAEKLEDLEARVTRMEEQQPDAAASAYSGPKACDSKGTAKCSGLRSRKQEAAIAALLTQPSVEKAARAVGINPKTLQHWMRTPEFDKAYRQARWANFSEQVARFQNAYSIALAVLTNLMNNPEARPASKVAAAEFVLEHTVQDLEQNDLRVRLALLREQESDPQNVEKGDEYRKAA